MALTPIDLPPGIYRNGTQYQTIGRWFDGNLIRWVDGVLYPVGGWTRISTTPLARKARGIFAWRTNGGERLCAIGTNNQLLATQAYGQIFYISPAAVRHGVAPWRCCSSCY